MSDIEQVNEGPSGSGVRHLLTCYPCVRTPDGTTKVSSEATLFQITESGRICPWKPATTPELVSEDEGQTLTSGRCLSEVFNAFNDSGSDVDEAIPMDEASVDEASDEASSRILRGNIIGREFMNESEEEEIEERVEGVRGRMGVASVDTTFAWQKNFSSFSSRKETFSLLPGPTFSSQDPLHIFYEIWDLELMSLIVSETNEYAWQVISQLSDPDMGTKIPGYLDSWTNVTVEELYRYFAILIFSSHCQRNNIRDYWMTGFLEMPQFCSIMSRNRFLLIHKFLHFASNIEMLPRSHDSKIEKILPVIDHCNRKFAGMYTPAQYLSLDESFLLKKGRLSCIRSKAAQCGFKLFELCEATTGYLLQMRIYTGKKTNLYPQSFHGFQDNTAKIVLDLMERYLDVGHVLVMEHWYNQLPLARFLKSRHTDVLGTINRRHFGIPSAIKDLVVKNVARGTVISRHCGDIALFAWKNVNLVTVMSTYHQNEMVPGTRARRDIAKPAAVQEYYRYMKGVGLKDKNIASYLLERKRNLKWYIKVFRRLLNISLLNCFVIYSRNPMFRSYSHQEFRLRVAEGLVGQNPRVPSVPSSIPHASINRLQPGTHYPIHTDVSSGAEKGKRKQLRCVRCVAKKRRTSVTVKCELCKVPLCIGPCWREFHSVLDLS